MNDLIYTQDIYTLTNNNLENDISRRKFIRQVSTASIGTAIAPLTFWTPKAEAALPPWLIWTGKAAAAAAIRWIVGKLLDRFLERPLKKLVNLFARHEHADYATNKNTANRLARALDIKKVIPRPTNDRFHNEYAAPYVVDNEDYHFGCVHSRKCGHHIALNHYLRFGRERHILTDLSIVEIQALAEFEQKLGIIFIPSGKRRPCDPDDEDGFQYKYARPLVHRNREYILYARKFKNKGKLLFCVGYV